MIEILITHKKFAKLFFSFFSKLYLNRQIYTVYSVRVFITCFHLNAPFAMYSDLNLKKSINLP